MTEPFAYLPASTCLSSTLDSRDMSEIDYQGEEWKARSWSVSEYIEFGSRAMEVDADEDWAQHRLRNDVLELNDGEQIMGMKLRFPTGKQPAGMSRSQRHQRLSLRVNDKDRAGHACSES